MDIEKPHSFHVLNILTVAWSKVCGVKGPLWLIWLVMVAVSLIITVIFGGLKMIVPLQGPTTQAAHTLGAMTARAFVIELVTLFFTIPLVAGILMLAIKRARNLKVTIHDGFQYFRLHYWWKLFAATLIFFIVFLVFTILINVIPFIDALGRPASSTVESLLAGLFMAVIFFIAFLVYLFTLFVIPAIADQDASVFSAFQISFQLVNKQWIRIILLLISVLVMAFVLMIPFLLALLIGSAAVILIAISLEFIMVIWTLPYFYMIYAEAYVRLADS